MKPRLSLSIRKPYICTYCRHISNTRTLHISNPPSPPPSAFANLPTRRLISLSGPDSTKYLQGVITANLKANTSSTAGFYTAFLNAQGRLLNDVFIYPYRDPKSKYGGDDGWLLEVDAAGVDRLAVHIKRYKLRSKFDVRVLGEDEMRVWSIWGENDASFLTDHGPELDSAQDIGCIDSRAPDMGRRLILPGNRKPELELEESSEGSYKVRRYLMGIPEGQCELVRESALPQESNIDFMGGIDYRKGCYVGQELTIRTHHTGVVRKRVLPVMVYAADEPEPQSLQYDARKELGVENIPSETGIGRYQRRGRSAGKWLAGVGNIGLGLCRLETMTGISVQGEAGGYKDGDEFTVEWDKNGEEGEKKMVKVKAFVPNWHLTKQ